MWNEIALTVAEFAATTAVAGGIGWLVSSLRVQRKIDKQGAEVRLTLAGLNAQSQTLAKAIAKLEGSVTTMMQLDHPPPRRPR